MCCDRIHFLLICYGNMLNKAEHEKRFWQYVKKLHLFHVVWLRSSWLKYNKGFPCSSTIINSVCMVKISQSLTSVKNFFNPCTGELYLSILKFCIWLSPPLLQWSVPDAIRYLTYHHIKPVQQRGAVGSVSIFPLLLPLTKKWVFNFCYVGEGSHNSVITVINSLTKLSNKSDRAAIEWCPPLLSYSILGYAIGLAILVLDWRLSPDQRD